MARRLARSKWLLPLVAAAAIVAAVSASVFVVYPVAGSLSFTKPPIVLDAGSNAGQADLGGNTISVTLGANATSATITLHPTYETTYYYNILYVNNTDTAHTYYVRFELSSNELKSGESITALIYNATSGALIDTVSLTANGTAWNTAGWIPLSAGGSLRIDFKILFPEGQPLPSTAQSFTLNVVYSTQNTENPPAAATS